MIFRYKRAIRILSLILLLGIAGYVALVIIDDRTARIGLATDLKIKSLPGSVRSLSCYTEPIWTDVLWHCYFEIEPKDFAALLTGRKYKVSALKTTSYAVLKRMSERGDLGQDFEIAKEYFVQPKEFEHGGAITIYTDTAQRHVLYDLYIE